MTPEPDPDPTPDPEPTTDATVTVTQTGTKKLTATMRAGDQLDSQQVWSTTDGGTYNMTSGSGYYLFVAHQSNYVPKSMKVNNVSVSGTTVTNGTVTWTRYNCVINTGTNTITFSSQLD